MVLTDPALCARARSRYARQLCSAGKAAVPHPIGHYVALYPPARASGALQPVLLIAFARYHRPMSGSCRAG